LGIYLYVDKILDSTWKRRVGRLIKEDGHERNNSLWRSIFGKKDESFSVLEEAKGTEFDFFLRNTKRTKIFKRKIHKKSFLKNVLSKKIHQKKKKISQSETEDI